MRLGREGESIKRATVGWRKEGVLWLRGGVCKEIGEEGEYKKGKLDFWGRVKGKAACGKCYVGER